jgi:esterase/lipase
MTSQHLEPCLFFHGLASDKNAVSTIKDIYENLDHPCFIPQLLGHRLTLPLKNEVRICNWDLESHTYIRYLTQNFKNKIIVSGQSFGTLLALKMALIYPDFVKGLILFSPSLKMRNTSQEYLISLLSYVPSIIAKKIGSIKKSRISINHINSNEEYSINLIKHLAMFRQNVINNLHSLNLPIYVVQSINDYHLCPTSSLIIKEKSKNCNVKVILNDFGNIHNLSKIPQMNGIIKNGLDFICQEK